MKQVIKINEQQLKKIVMESVEEVFNEEEYHKNFNTVKTSRNNADKYLYKLGKFAKEINDEESFKAIQSIRQTLQNVSSSIMIKIMLPYFRYKGLS